MKTRIIWTKLWDDSWFDSLSQNSRILFIYLLTNQDIGLSGCYYLTDKKICFHTHLTEIELEVSKIDLVNKIMFFDNWIYVLNAQGYNGFVGLKNDVAVTREINLIPQNVKNTFGIVKQHRVSEKDDRVLATPDTSIIINHKSEIINPNKKSEIRKQKSYNLVGNTMVEVEE